jgi:Uma2 family endonuclease
MNMATIDVRKLMTLAEFEQLPVGPPHYEFEAGEAIPVTSPTPEHQDVVDVLVSATRQHVREHRLGRVFREVDVYLADGRVYIPDISFLSSERLHLLDPSDRKIHGAPDLVVEAMSSDAARDRIHKFQVYYRNGIQWYWLVDVENRTIEEYRATPEGFVLAIGVDSGEDFHPQLFPGLVINLASLLED